MPVLKLAWGFDRPDVCTRAWPRPGFEFLEATYGSVCRSTRCDEAAPHSTSSTLRWKWHGRAARAARSARSSSSETWTTCSRSRVRSCSTLFGHSENSSTSRTTRVPRDRQGSSPSSTARFVVKDDGTFVSAGRYVDVEVGACSFRPRNAARRRGLGRLQRRTNAIAVVVSQAPVVRVFTERPGARGHPELFLMSELTSSPPSRRAPGPLRRGVTLAVADWG